MTAKTETPNPEGPLGTVLRLILRLLKILFLGRNQAARLEWVRDALSAALHLTAMFPEKFDYETRREIERKLREANLCKQFDPIREDWKPELDWEILLKMAIELILALVHDFSPKPGPDSDLAKYVCDWVKANVKDPEMKKQAKTLSDTMLHHIETLNKNPAISTPKLAREAMRQACTAAAPQSHKEWLTFSAMITAYLDDINDVPPGLNLPQLFDLWTEIAKGLMEAAR